MKCGPKVPERKAAFLVSYPLTKRKVWRWLDEAGMDILDACADEAARRLLMGCSEQFAPGEQPEPVPLRKRKRALEPVRMPHHKRPAILLTRKPPRRVEPEDEGEEELGPRVARMMRLAALAGGER